MVIGDFTHDEGVFGKKKRTPGFVGRGQPNPSLLMGHTNRNRFDRRGNGN